jgi:NADPH:quinone reductase-like Zn-dependent oxidoreductase
VKSVIVDAIGQVKNARVRSMADPVPGAGEVCVKVNVVQINFPGGLVMEQLPGEATAASG